jgi:hypothetical protein
MGIEFPLSRIEFDGKSYMTYTSNVYITQAIYDTDSNLFDRRGKGATGNYRSDTGDEAK